MMWPGRCLVEAVKHGAKKDTVLAFTLKVASRARGGRGEKGIRAWMQSALEKRHEQREPPTGTQVIKHAMKRAAKAFTSGKVRKKDANSVEPKVLLESVQYVAQEAENLRAVTDAVPDEDEVWETEDDVEEDEDEVEEV